MFKKTRLVILIAVLFVLTGCSVSFSTANITEPGMATSIVDGYPIDTVTSYAQNTDELYAYGVLNNAPDDTTVRFVWNYVTEPQEIYTVEMNNEGESGIYVFSSLTNNGPWPLGDYSVDIFIDDREEPDQTITFSVE